jgi:hypothetical protein
MGARADFNSRAVDRIQDVNTITYHNRDDKNYSVQSESPNLDIRVSPVDKKF